MSSLLSQQMTFTKMLCRLLAEAQRQGFGVTLGDAYRDPRCPYGTKHSAHQRRLAIDLNLFRGGVYLAATESHRSLGEYWERLGGIWGGRFARPDGNHYQWPDQPAEMED